MADSDHNLDVGATAVDASAVEQGIIAEQHPKNAGDDNPPASDVGNMQQDLRAVRRELRAVRSALSQLGHDKEEGAANDDSATVNPMSLAQGELQQAIMHERLAGLESHAAQLEAALLAAGAAPDTAQPPPEALGEALLAVEKAAKKQRKQRKVQFQAELQEDDLFDAAEAVATKDAKVSLVETERDRLIRLGVLTPFDRLGGFERQIERGGVTAGAATGVQDPDAAIAKITERYRQIRENRHTTKLVQPSELPRKERSTKKVDESFWRAAASKHNLPVKKKKRKSTLPRAQAKRRRPMVKKQRRNESDEEEIEEEVEHAATNSDGEEYDLTEEDDEELLDTSGRFDDANEADYVRRHEAYLKTRSYRRNKSESRTPLTSVAADEDLEESGLEEAQGNVSDDNDLDESEENEDVVFQGGYRVPGDLYAKLFPYQQTAIKWMWELHTQRAGGIIGDEMGLGKTIQIIAFLAGLHHSGHFKPSLIVCPATVLQQWLREIRAWYPPFRVAILHDSLGGHAKGTSRSQLVKSIASSPAGILLTTYDQLRLRRAELLPIRWGYAVLDEGHKIRNPDAEVTLVAKQLATVHRIIMSGSPIQNRLTELWSLFDFVFPGKLGTLPVFQAQFALPIAIGGYANASPLQVSAAYKCAVVLRDLIAPYLLRRRKADVATALPKKTERVLFCTLTQEQREMYRAYLASKELSDILAGNRAALAGIDVLRKICNHPDLLERAKWEAAADYGNVERSGKLKVLEKLLKHWHETEEEQGQKHKVLVFTQTQQSLDIIERMVNLYNFPYHRMDGSTSIATRSRLIDDFNNNPDIFVFLLTTRVGGLGVNLTGANRCVIYDPDWNPSTDVQARERAWRIGQSREVAVYRLITSGTIEEKVYHRQVYKQFLTDKVLRDPRQKRFFKARDLSDLFTLGDEYAEGTETAEIFASLDTEIRADALDEGEGHVGNGNGSQPPVSPSDRDDYESGDDGGEGGNAAIAVRRRSGVSREEDVPEGDEANNGTSKNGDAQILKDLFDGRGGVQAALDHDKIEGAHNPEHRMAQKEATKIAQRAAQALRQSRSAVRQAPVNQPTWTGRSGGAGMPDFARSGGFPRFGATVNPKLQQNSNMPSGVNHRFGSAAVATNGGVLRSSDLLARMRERQAAVAAASDATPEVAQAQTLAERVAVFLQRRGGSAASSDIASNFQGEVGPHDAALFRGVLRQVSTLEKRGNSKVWVLKPEFRVG